MSHRQFAAGIALAALNAFGFVGSASAVDLQRPTKLMLTPHGNLLVAENGTAASPLTSAGCPSSTATAINGR
jgi:hypothetical protein